MRAPPATADRHNHPTVHDDAPPSPPPATPFAAASFTEALGGPLGLAESSLPPIVYVTAYTVTGQDAELSAIIALVLGGLLTLGRLVRRQTLQYALSGLAGVAIAAFVVSRTGKAEDFFLPGILANLAYAAAYAISIVVRWPLIGVIVSTVQGHGRGWREDPVMVAKYTRATWLWVGLFVTRLAVQLPLYFAGAVVALGVVKVAMGLPLFALAAWATYLLLRDRPTAPVAAT